MKKSYDTNDTKFMNENKVRKADQAYSYYSRLLKEPFDTVEELCEAEEAYYAKLKAKEDKAAAKKADALVVEDAFKALNVARKDYKVNLTTVTDSYRDAMTELKNAFESDVEKIKANLATAEDNYKKALKAFADKYPEGYHITLKDGDFETTISSNTSTKTGAKYPDIFDMLFGFHF